MLDRNLKEDGGREDHLFRRLETFDVSRKPLGQLVPTDSASRHVKDKTFLLANGSSDLPTVQSQEYFHRSVAHPLVSIYKRVALDQGKPKRGRFLYGRGVQLLSAELHLRLANRRNESAPIPKPRAPSRRFDKAPMEIKDFGDAQVSHDIRRL